MWYFNCLTKMRILNVELQAWKYSLCYVNNVHAMLLFILLRFCNSVVRDLFKQNLSICHFVLIINVQYLVSVALSLVINLIFLYNFPVTKWFKSIKYKELWALYMQYNLTTDTKIFVDIWKYISSTYQISEEKTCHIWAQLVTISF